MNFWLKAWALRPAAHCTEGCCRVAPEMFDLLLFLVAAFGAANIMGFLKISKPLRKTKEGLPRTNPLSQLIACPACLGFWLGVAGSFALPYNPLELGCITSASSWFMYGLLKSFGTYDN